MNKNIIPGMILIVALFSLPSLPAVALPRCGDGVLQFQDGEQCEPAGIFPCHNDCRLAVCGDGIVDADFGETCDPPGSVLPNGNVCQADCTFCGDGTVQSQEGELCEPPGTASCDNACQPIGKFCSNSNPLLGSSARKCTVLQTDALKVSITGPAGHIQGDVCIGAGGSLSMSGENFILGDVHFETVLNCSGCTTTSTGRVRGAEGTGGVVDVNATLVGNAADECDQTSFDGAHEPC